MSRRPFHRDDFSGGAGPGLAKLRAVVGAVEKVAQAGPAGKSGGGLAALKAFMAAGDWPKAILAAAKFPDLGDQAAAIHRGREAILRPEFQKQIKRDPAMMIDEAKAALIERYGND